MSGIKATRPSVGTQYSDVLIQTFKGKYWLEVKMNHTDNLTNPRVFFDGTKWNTTYKTGAAKLSVDLLNKSTETKRFLREIAKFSGIKKPIIPTTKTGLKDPRAIPLDVMKLYFEQPGINRYILKVPDVNLGQVVTDHYTKGKEEPVYYMQAADDFYRIGSKNPLGLPNTIPLLKGIGEFKVRIATRSQYYEVQAEIKITKMPKSPYSLAPRTNKKNPFLLI